jgi:hypothetical protein
MAKPILYVKARCIPSPEDMANINQKLNNEYYILFMQTGQGENESVQLLNKGRDTKTLTKQLKKLIDLNNGKA